MSPADRDGAVTVIPVWANVSLYGGTSLVVRISGDEEGSTLVQEEGSLVLTLSEYDLFSLPRRKPPTT